MCAPAGLHEREARGAGRQEMSRQHGHECWRQVGQGPSPHVTQHLRMLAMLAGWQGLSCGAWAAAGAWAMGVSGQLGGVVHLELASAAWILQLAGQPEADMARRWPTGAAPAMLALPAMVQRRLSTPERRVERGAAGEAGRGARQERSRPNHSTSRKRDG